MGGIDMKNNKFKRLTALLLAVLMLFLTPSIAFCASDEEEIVATVSVYCYSKNPGHCWLYIDNLTNETFTVGAYSLGAYQGVSVATFGFTRHDGWGIYYNVEAYVLNTHGIGNCASFTEELTREELYELSDTILSQKNSWSLFANCTSFAAKVWNTVSDKKIAGLVFPSFVKILMKLRGAKSGTPDMKPVSKDEVYRQKGNGNNSYLVNVSERSLGELV